MGSFRVRVKFPYLFPNIGRVQWSPLDSTGLQYTPVQFFSDKNAYGLHMDSVESSGVHMELGGNRQDLTQPTTSTTPPKKMKGSELVAHIRSFTATLDKEELQEFLDLAEETGF
jgi:hypothetical protein